MLRIAALCVLALLSGAAPAAADFGIASFDGMVLQADGSAATQAGSHPFAVRTSFTFPTHVDGNGTEVLDGSVKTIRVELPAGLIGDPTAVPRCTAAQLDSDPDGTATRGPGCPNSTQVGTITLLGLLSGFPFEVPLPVYNMETRPGVPAVFAFNLLGQIVHMNARVRADGDYGIDLRLEQVSQGIALKRVDVEFWGVPADPGHDAARKCPAGTANPCSSPAAPRPFLTLPTRCAGPQDTRLTVSAWQVPGSWSRTFTSHDEHGAPVGVTGCHRVPFSPAAKVAPTSRAAGAPTGLDVEFRIPHDDNPDGIVQAHLKRAVVTLPAGMTVNAAGSSGLAACTPAQIGLGREQPAACPDAARIGTVEIDSPLVDHPLPGSVYLAAQHDNPFGSLLALYIAVHDPDTGIVLKLPGRIDPDPATGQLTITVDNNPQLPFRSFRLRMNGGSRAPLSNPAACGSYEALTALTSWASERVAASRDGVVVDQGCEQAGRFTPAFSAGVADPRGGASSAFALDLVRPDGQPAMTALSVRLAKGLLARLADVPLCPEDRAGAGTCDAASAIGRATIAAGTGATPAYLPQAGRAPTAVYLAGPYKGAPFSLSIVVPAQAGPLDLGTVVVRSALHVDPITAEVTVVSDPFPTILDGIPLDIQRIRIDIDRPGFMLNPTSCAERAISGSVTSAAGRTGNPVVDAAGAGYATAAGPAAEVRSRFRVGGCRALPLKPKLSLKLTGKRQTTDGKHPAVIADLRLPAGGANLRKVAVRLPLTLALDVNNANGLCEFEPGSRPLPVCPRASIVGSATAVTPILGERLSGPVYFVKHERLTASGRRRRTLPKLVIPLQGQGVRLTITGMSSVDDQHLVTTFRGIPDAPVSRFTLNINGGKHGILAINRSICRGKQFARRQVDGQNGRTADARVRIATPACRAQPR